MADERFATWTEYFNTIYERLTDDAITAYEKEFRCTTNR
jgi:hypothetical protein